ncbi:MAG: hypothetical protein ACE5JX_04810 [Acidobacteriota bacterium]
MALDEEGQYTVFLGTTKKNGIPLDLFTTGKANWLGIQIQGEPEQPRLPFVSVPYALKAEEAERLSGKSVTEFVLIDRLLEEFHNQIQEKGIGFIPPVVPVPNPSGPSTQARRKGAIRVPDPKGLTRLAGDVAFLNWPQTWPAAQTFTTANVDLLNKFRVVRAGGKYPTIQDAIDDLPAGGGVVFIPPGEYRLAAPLVITKRNVRLVGVGWARTASVAAGTRLVFTGATDGIQVNAPPGGLSGIIIENLGILTDNPAGGSAIMLDGTLGTVAYSVIRNVHIEPRANASWAKGIELIRSQNITVENGIIFANAGKGIKHCISLDGPSQGNTFLGVSITGDAHGGTATGVTTTGGASFSWFGGVVQGGFTTAAFNIVLGQAYIYGTHVEVNPGGGFGYIYDNSALGTTVVGPRGGSFSIGPSANAWDFSLIGGSVGEITLGEFAKNPIIMPAQVNRKLIDNGASYPFIGQFRRVGRTIPESIRIGKGISPEGDGFKHARFQSCTTSAQSGTTCDTSFSWEKPFVDARYTVTCSITQSAAPVRLTSIPSKRADGITVRIEAATDTATSGTLECMAVHD